MLLLTLQLSWIEAIVLLIGALTLGCTLYFFYTSQRSLRQALGSMPKPALPAAPPARERSPLFARKTADPVTADTAATPVLPVQAEEKGVGGLKDSFREQQRTIQTLLQRVAQLEQIRQEAQQTQPLLQRIRELEAALHQNEAALSSAKEQEPMVAQLSARLDEVYRHFGQLQQQGAVLQRQAAAAGELAIKLEDLQLAYDTLAEEMELKQAQLLQLQAENMRLQQQLLQGSSAVPPPAVPVLFPIETAPDNKASTDERRSLLQKQLQRITELESLIEQFGATAK